MIIALLALLALAVALWWIRRGKQPQKKLRDPSGAGQALRSSLPVAGLEASRGVRPDAGSRTRASYAKTQPLAPQHFSRPSESRKAQPRPAQVSRTEQAPTVGSRMWLPRSGAARLPELTDANGLPALRLMEMTVDGETALRLCHVGTGLWTVEGDTRLPRAGIWAVKLRGAGHHRAAMSCTNLSLGSHVQLRREPDNPHDPFAVAVMHHGQRLGYYNKAKAKRLAKLLDDGVTLEAICLEPKRGWVLAAEPHVLAHLRRPWPAGSPRPAQQEPSIRKD